LLQAQIAGKIKTHVLCSVTFFFRRKSCRLWDNVERDGSQMTIQGWW